MPLLTATTVIGIGVGGFIDGIVFHQIMQWHSMLSRILPPATWIAKSVNMFWDGIFHAFTLLVVVTGVYMLFKLINQNSVIKSGKVFNDREYCEPSTEVPVIAATDLKEPVEL